MLNQQLTRELKYFQELVVSRHYVKFLQNNITFLEKEIGAVKNDMQDKIDKLQTDVGMLLDYIDGNLANQDLNEDVRKEIIQNACDKFQAGKISKSKDRVISRQGELISNLNKTIIELKSELNNLKSEQSYARI